MIIDDIKKIKSSKSDLRKFGITVGIVLGLLGGLLWWKDRDVFPIFLGVSVGFIVFGLILPAVLKPIQKVWMTLALLLGWVMTRVILSVMFFLLFLPISQLAKLFGKDFLDQKIKPDARSYWILREPKDQKEKMAYEKQF